MEDKTVYGFNASNADRLLGLIRPNGEDTIGKYGDTRQHILLAVATNGVPARVGTTLGKATVAVRALDYSGANVVISNPGWSVEAHNIAGTAVSTGAYILIHQVNTFWIVIWEECANG